VRLAVFVCPLMVEGGPGLKLPLPLNFAKMESGMRERTPFIPFVLRHRSELLMWALVAEMIASPVADHHPLIGAGLAITWPVGKSSASPSYRLPGSG
jgi:hypothetical protein